MLKSPLLLGPVNLPQLVDAGVEGVTAGLNVSSIAEKLGERGRFRLAAEGHGVRAEPVQAAAYVTGKQSGPERKEPERLSHPNLHFRGVTAFPVPCRGDAQP